MRALSQIEKTEVDRFGSENTQALMADGVNPSKFAVDVSVYRGSTCIFENNFIRSRLSIGRVFNAISCCKTAEFPDIT